MPSTTRPSSSSKPPEWEPASSPHFSWRFVVKSRRHARQAERARRATRGLNSTLHPLTQPARRLVGSPLRATFSPAHPLADIFHPPYPPIASQSISRDVPIARARASQFSLPPFRGVAEAALYCAHRTSTFLSCAFCEQEGHLAAPSSPLFFVLMNVDDLSRVIDFDRHL